jgi:hypothetical protein
MARIKQWGGFVSPAPDPGLSARVYLDAEFTMIGLAMSRSIGEFMCTTSYVKCMYMCLRCLCHDLGLVLFFFLIV